MYFTTMRELGSDSTRFGLWSLGSANERAPMALSFISDASSGSFVLQGAGAVCVNGDNLFVAFSKSAAEVNIYRYSPNGNRTSFQVDLGPTDLGVPEADKQLMRVAVNTLPTASNVSVGIQYRPDYGASPFTPIDLQVQDDTYRYGTLRNAEYARKYQFRITPDTGGTPPVVTNIEAHFEVSNPSEFGQ